jgi:unconventional prefoldin RPB5 interactor 1
MAQPVKDSFLDLERHRQLLEDNIAKLRKSLQHWQTWEAEYEGFKEEILAGNSDLDRGQLLDIGRQYEGDLVTQKEIRDILGTDTSRSATQVVNILERRIDYVQQNVHTVQKQIDIAENKLAAATIISTPDVRNEEGLPVTEIIEELDDDGNIIASRLSTPGSAKPQLLEVLQKAGVENLPIEKTLGTNSISSKDETNALKKAPSRAKKGVSFTEDTKAGPEQQQSKTARRIEDIMKLAKQSEISSEAPIIPTNESSEDAALRREMLQYGSMSEVGAVVAELDLEEGSDWSDEEYDDHSTSSDEEDAFGRSTSRVVSDEVRQRMIELEERLGARVMQNIGKKASDYDIVQEGIGRVSIQGQSEDTNLDDATVDTSQKDNKKLVRFSENLDIAPSVNPAVAPSRSVAKERVQAPVSDIIERVAPAAVAQITSSGKVSRFKTARSSELVTQNAPMLSIKSSNSHPALPTPAQSAVSNVLPFAPANERIRVVPTGPEGKTLASTIIEHDVALDIEAAAPDEMDPQLLNQEVATEYHRLRNRMIQRQGGFMREEESEIVPFTEEEGGPKKISRFKAARLARS